MQIGEDAAPDVGGHAFGTTQNATLEDEGGRAVWLTVIERSLVPSQVDVSAFMARMGEFLGAEHPAVVPVRLVDREADFCVVGYEAMPGAVPLQRRIEGAGSTAGLVARVAVEVARGLAHLHAKGRVHGALAPGNIVLWRDGVSLWQQGLAVACSSTAVAPRLRALGGDVVAPEVRSGGAPNATSDVFAWGAVIAALATDTVGAAALAAVEEGELDAGLLTAVIKEALGVDAHTRPADGLALLRRIASASIEDDGPGAARQAELRELANRYVDEVEGRDSQPKKKARSKRRQFRRTATEIYPPGLAPIAGVMIAPDEPEPDPFTVPTDAVAPPEVHQEEPQRVPTPAPVPMKITARRIEDEPAKHFNPDALTPPDGARLAELDKGAEEPAKAKVSPGGVSIPPLVGAPGAVDDDLTPVPKETTPEAAPLPPPPEPPSAPIPPPPQHDDMSPEDSGFGLSIPVAETLDSRLDRDPVSDVVGALAAAESSPHLSTVDGAEAEPNPAASGPKLELDLPPRPSARPKAAPKPAPKPVAPPPAAKPKAPSLALDLGKPPSEPAKPKPKPEAAGGSALPLSGSSATDGPGIPGATKLELDLDAARSGPRPMAAESAPARPRMVDAPKPMPMRREALAEARGPRGSTMAALIGFGVTILAAGLTIPVAEKRGGLSVLLGNRAPDEPETKTEAPPEPAPPAADVGTDTPPPAPTSCPEDMAPLPKSAKVCIDRGEQPGLREFPTSSLTHAEAAASCEAQGRRLCSAKEWRRACRGTAGRRLPYDGPRREGQCNDALDGVPQNPGRGGARETCVTPEGVYDLVGNVGEWVQGGAVMGGDAATTAASCSSRRKPGKNTQEPGIGYRCCLTLAEH